MSRNGEIADVGGNEISTMLYINCATAHHCKIIMNQQLTEKEIEKIRNACFDNPVKMCAIAQVIIDTCQIVSSNTYADLKGKHRNTILKQKDKLTGITIANRKFISINQ